MNKGWSRNTSADDCHVRQDQFMCTCDGVQKSRACVEATASPTPSPTRSPTANPTPSPTNAPTPDSCDLTGEEEKPCDGFSTPTLVSPAFPAEWERACAPIVGGSDYGESYNCSCTANNGIQAVGPFRRRITRPSGENVTGSTCNPCEKHMHVRCSLCHRNPLFLEGSFP
jgi:hypothetical protein